MSEYIPNVAASTNNEREQALPFVRIDLIEAQNKSKEKSPDFFTNVDRAVLDVKLVHIEAGANTDADPTGEAERLFADAVSKGVADQVMFALMQRFWARRGAPDMQVKLKGGGWNNTYSQSGTSYLHVSLNRYQNCKRRSEVEAEAKAATQATGTEG